MVKGDQIVLRRESGVIKVPGEPARVEEEWVQYNDRRLSWVKASYVPIS